MLSLRSAFHRKAQFKTVIVLFSPDGKEHTAEGILKGLITDKARGTGGFGYDPIFIPDGEMRTLAEMSIAEKNMMSHRAIAFEQLRPVFS
jgi:XTP/dITP diphosphohydrolase